MNSAKLSAKRCAMLAAEHEALAAEVAAAIADGSGDIEHRYVHRAESLLSHLPIGQTSEWSVEPEPSPTRRIHSDRFSKRPL